MKTPKVPYNLQIGLALIALAAAYLIYGITVAKALLE